MYLFFLLKTSKWWRERQSAIKLNVNIFYSSILKFEKLLYYVYYLFIFRCIKSVNESKILELIVQKKSVLKIKVPCAGAQN